MQRIEILTADLCEEIDYWKSEANKWKSLYEEERDANIKAMNERFEESKKGVANALLFALSVSDNPDGSLSINKENRKQLAESFK